MFNRKPSSQTKPHVLLKCFFLVVLLVLFAFLFFVFNKAPSIKGFKLPKNKKSFLLVDKPLYQTRFVSNVKTRYVHSPAAVEISDGKLFACWYGGSREGGRDVCVYSAVFNPQNSVWCPEQVLITGKDTQKNLGRYIKTLGNPVIIKDKDSRLWLFYVSVSFGGWSGSGINLITSSDEGANWTSARRLIASPFFNLSTLVQGAPFIFENGAIGLPVYHEFIGKFCELLCLNRAGDVIRKTRISWGRSSIQPVIVPVTQTDGLCLMRYCGNLPATVLSARTTDGGITWSAPVKTDIPNPDSAVASVRMEDGSLLLIHNNSDDLRCDLTLSYSGDNGRAWRTIYEFEADDINCEDHDAGFSYPYIIQTLNGDFHLLYSWNNTRIKHVQFNSAWVKQQL